MKQLGEIVEIDCSLIRPMPGQPRKRFDRLEMERLTLSIKRIGQRRPITVREYERGHYELVDGERRFRACRQLQIAVKAWVKPVCDVKDQFLESVVSNFCAAPHDELETYDAIVRIREENGFTAEETADAFGKSAAWVTVYLSLGKLDPQLRARMSRELPDEKRLLLGHAIEIARLPEKEQQREMARAVASERLSLPQLKYRVSQILAGTLDKPRRPQKEREKLENFLRRSRQDLEILLMQKPEYFREVFGSVDTFRRDELMTEIRGMVEDLNALYSMLQKKVWRPDVAVARAVSC